MAVVTFDTLKFANTLKAAGVPDKQAEAQASAFSDVIHVNLKDLVTKDDLERSLMDFKTEILRAILDLRTEIVSRFESFDQKFENKLEQNSTRLEAKIDQESRKIGASIDEKINLADKRISDVDSKYRTDVVLLRWMVGVAVLGILGLLLRSIFRTPII